MVEPDQLCQICAEVDLYRLFTGPRYFPHGPKEPIPFQKLGTLKDIKCNANCPLCRLVKHVLYENADAPRRYLQDLHDQGIAEDEVQCMIHPIRQDYMEEVKYENPRTRDLVATEMKLQLRGTQDCSPEKAPLILAAPFPEGFQLLSPDSVDPARPLANGFPVTTMERNLELLSQWLQTCQNTHKDTCEQGLFSTTSSPAGLNRIRVIDVQSRSISECNIAGLEYAALSYVWGMNKETRIKLVSDLPLEISSSGTRVVSLPSEMPKIVEDALRICATLSIKYLWVDLYCINQDDVQQKAAEINAMGYIYNHAQITLVDGSGETSTDANAGLLPENMTSDLGAKQRIETISNKSYITSLPALSRRLLLSQWQTRSWTYQEGALSRRVAIFDDFDVSFMCGAGLWCERLHSGQYGHDANITNLDLRSSGYQLILCTDWLQSADWNFGYYNSILMAYSGRELSFESDKVAAISGCFNILANNMDVHFICGLPTKDFHYALLWDGQKDQVRDGFPSWSWAGWHSLQQVHRLYPRQETSGSLVLGKMDDIYEYQADTSLDIELAGNLINGANDTHKTNRCSQRLAPLQLFPKLSTVVITSEMAHFSVEIIASETDSDLYPEINTRRSEVISWDPEKMYRLGRAFGRYLVLRTSGGSQYSEDYSAYRPWPLLRIGLPWDLCGSTITWLLRDGIDLVNILDIDMLEGDAGGDSLPSRRVFCLGIDRSRGGNHRMGTVHMTREMWEAADPVITRIELS
ncbi:hypothetical protein G7054_g1204 [Neopestalotiopsis clavispora]|nr:hypothetical protein G7054_g1204 [Neopestalotiopsis clavispora]